MKASISFVAFCSALAFATPAFAQDTAESGEIIVTAQRRDERLQDVPMTIAALSGDSLASRGIDRPDALFSQIPGISLQSPSGSAGFPIYNIRGVSLVDFSYTSESPVAVYVDDVYQGNTALFSQPLYDVERVEALKGPQGTLYGRNTTGGLIHFITKRPTDTFTANAYVSYGRFNEVIAGGAISGPITDAVRARFATQYKSNTGWQTNAVNGDKFGRVDHNISTRLEIEADLSEKATLLLIGDYTDAAGVNDLRTLKGYRDPNNLAVTCSQTRILAGECVNASGFGVSNPDPTIGYTSNTTGDIGYALTIYGLSGRLDRDVGIGKLTSITAYKYGKKRDATDLDASAIAPANVVFATAGTHEQFSQELRLAGENGRLNWQVGAFYYRDSRFYSNGLPFLPASARNANYSDQKIESYSGYADLTYALTDTINLTGGLRYTHDQKTLDLTYLTGPVVIGTRLGNPRFTFHDAISGNKLTWRAVADWHVMPDVMLFASVATGYKSGGYNTTTVTSPTTAGPVRPETNTQFEVGLKSSLLDKKLTFNLTGYHIEWKGIQSSVTVTTGDPNNPLVSSYLNIGDASIWGAEVEAVLRPVRDLTMSVGASYNHNRISAPANLLIGGLPLNGNHLANTPKTSINGAVSYEPRLGGGSRLLFGAEVAYQSSKYFRPDNPFYSLQPAYALVDGRVGWASQDDRLRITVFGKNLFDKAYFVSGTALSDSALYQWGQPRTYGVRLETKW